MIGHSSFLQLFSLYILSILPLICICSPTWAEIADKDSVWRVTKSQDFEITGDGNASNWKEVQWVTLPSRKNMGVNYQTQVKLLYSDTGIYCLFRCEDNKITATLKEDFADLYKEDVVEVFFWTDEATPMYFEYELSPLNYELPILVPNFKGDFFGWRPWHYTGDRKTRHATHVSQKKGDSAYSATWMAEFFIPFALLKPLKNVPAKKGTTWRANFYRIDYDKGFSSWTWQAIRQNFHDIEMYGTLLFE